MIGVEVETFVQFESWRGIAVLLNLFTFFFAFAAFSVGMLIARKVKRAVHEDLAGVVHAFLVAAGALTIRSLAIILYLLRAIDPFFAVVTGDLMVIVVGAALFYAYVVFERHLKRL